MKKLIAHVTLPEAKETLSEVWLNAALVTVAGLRLSDEVIRISIGLCLCLNLCELLVCTWAKFVYAEGLYSFSCKRSAGEIARHDLLNDVIFRAILSTKIITKKEPLSFLQNWWKKTRWCDGYFIIKENVLYEMLLFHANTFTTSDVNDISSKATSAAGNLCIKNC